MASPTIPTVKRLFAVSGNECAFPRCTQPLVHEGKVTGRICHIKAASPGGPRYDPDQTDEARHSFENLILMCPIHHDVIDADEIAYTVERLIQMKQTHEQAKSGGPDIGDEAARQIIIDLSGASVRDGSIIVTHNQVGGQVAHTIHNYGPPKRIISSEIRGRMLAVLSRVLSPAKIGFASTQGDIEAHQFKLQLIEVFREAGFDVQDLETFMFFGNRQGLVMTIPFGAPEAGLPQIVADALHQTGNPLQGNRGDMAKECGIYVQVWSAP